MKPSLITLTNRLLGASLSVLLASSLGCAGQEPVIGDGSEDPADPGDPDDPDSPETPVDATGRYQLASRFDMVSGMPGTVGSVVNTFVEMTDDPYDPATWLIDTVLEEWDGPGWAENMIQNSRPVLDGMIHELMLQHAPDIVDQLVAIGDDFGQVAREFGVDSTLEVADDADLPAGTHTVIGYRFDIDSVEYTYSLAELDSDPVVVEGVGFALSGDRVSVGEHSVPLRYGGFLAMILEDLIIPLVNPDATSLAGLFDELVDCYAIGYRMWQEFDWMSPEFYEGLCETGLQAGADYVIGRLVSIDEAAQVTLVIAGEARAADSDGDRRIDKLVGGKWTGGIDYAGDRGELAEDANTFTGERM